MYIIKVAIFSDTYLPQINGVVQTVVNTERELHERGIETCLFIPRTDSKISFNLQNNVFACPAFKFFLYPELKVAIPLQHSINKKLLAFAPDVVQLITPFTMGLTGLRHAIHNRIPVIGSYLTDFSSIAGQYGAQAFSGPLWHYLHWFYSKCDLTVSPSQDIMGILETRGLHELALWQPGVDLKDFSPLHRNLSLRKQFAGDDEIILLYVGRLACEKEIEVLLKADQLLENHQVKHRLIIVGDGPQSEHLRLLAGKKVLFLGFKSGKDLQEIYATADIFAFPSSLETCGIVVLEAMASGLPVVGSDCGGVSELIKDGWNGFKFHKGDSEEMAKYLEILIQNIDLRKRLQSNAIYFSQQFTWQNSADQLVGLYSAVQSKNSLVYI